MRGTQVTPLICTHQGIRELSGHDSLHLRGVELMKPSGDEPSGTIPFDVKY